MHEILSHITPHTMHNGRMPVVGGLGSFHVAHRGRHSVNTEVCIHNLINASLNDNVLCVCMS